MSGNHSRRKGAAAERELTSLIHEQLGVRLERRLEQTRSGGFDLAPAPGQSGPVVDQMSRFATECKRCARVMPAMVREWWRQAFSQAAGSGLVPTPAYREDRADWRLVVPLSELAPDMPSPLPDSLDYCAELTLPGWADSGAIAMSAQIAI